MEAKTATGASVSSASGENEDVDAAERASQDASLIPLTTHVLQRLLTLLRDHASTTASASAAAASAGAKGSESKKKKKKSKSTSKSAAAADTNEEEDDEANQLQVQVAVVTIALSYSLTQLLLADRPRLEKCAHHTTPPALVSSIRSCATWFAFRSSPPARTVSVFFVLPPTFFFPLFFPATASPKNPNVPASPPFFFFFASWPLRALPLRARRRVREGWMGTSERRVDGDE